MRECDMIANLTRLPACAAPDGIKIKRAFPGDKEQILAFIGERFSKSWVYETEWALAQNPRKCFIATENGAILGFACYDASAKGFFGPIGVAEEARGRRVGQALLLRTLTAMREDGYGYAIIGWVGDAEPFYRKCVGARYIEGGEPENSVYADLIRM